MLQRSLNLLLVIFALSCSTDKQNQETANDEQLPVSTEFLTDSSLRQMNLKELRIARNEVFARKGYKFRSADLQEHFSNTTWYKPQLDNVDSLLSTSEVLYVNKIRTLEENLKKVNSFEFNIDEDYLENYNYVLGIKKPGYEVSKLKNPKFTIPKWESQFDYVRNRAVYFKWEEFSLNDSIGAKIISAEWPNDEFDGEPTVLFFVTYLNDLIEIDCQRVGLVHSASDVIHSQYSIIQSGTISSNSEITTIGEDGELVEQNLNEEFRILANGKIEKTSR